MNRTDMDQSSRQFAARGDAQAATIIARWFTVKHSVKACSPPRLFPLSYRVCMPILVRHLRRSPPEVDLIVKSFLGHFAWEILQAPLFASLSGSDHFVGIANCLKATIGDLATALAAFWRAAFAE